MNCNIIFFENDIEIPLNHITEQERKSIEDTIYNFVIDKKDCDGIDLNYSIICNVNEKIISKFLNKKTVFNPPQYGEHSWGKVELLFSLMDENEQQKYENIINKLKQDTQRKLEEQTEKLKNMKLKKSSRKKSNDNVSVTSFASSASKKSIISDITTISDISLAKECSTRKCSKCKLPGHNISKCPLSKDTKDISKVIKKCSNCKLPGHNINKCPSRKDISSNLVPDTDSETESKVSKSRKCSNCSQSGHNINKCPSRKDISSNLVPDTDSESKISKSRKCSKCSQPGHTIRKCPIV